MMKVTVSTGQGKTMTTTDPFALSDRLTVWGVRAAKGIVSNLMRGNIQAAGDQLEACGINFAWAPSPEYFVPVDPASLTDCDSCQ